MSRGRNRRREAYDAQPLPGIVGMIEDAPFGPRWQEAKRLENVAARLRQRYQIVRLDSHAVARNPFRWWTMVRCANGYVHAFADPIGADWFIRRKAQFCGGVVERFNVRWKKPTK